MSLFERLVMNLQYFAADDGSGGGDGDPDPNNAGSEQAGTDNPDNKSEDNKTFSQEDVNSIASKEAKKAQEKLFKELGIEDFDNAKEGFQKFKEWQDSQKTEQEKKDEQLGQLEKASQEKDQAISHLTAQLSAMKQGVNPDSLEDVIALAERQVSDDVTIDAAIKSVIEKYPHFSAVSDEEEGVPSIYKPGNPNGGNNSNNNNPFASKLAKYK